jgi:MEKHLA domain
MTLPSTLFHLILWLLTWLSYNNFARGYVSVPSTCFMRSRQQILALSSAEDHHQPQPRVDSSGSTIPPGRVKNLTEWIQWSSDSLFRVYNQSLLEIMGLSSIDEVHTDTRFAVLSHNVDDDPIYCYTNQATRDIFQYTEDEYYQLPSRYSAPSGIARKNRQVIMDQSNQGDVWIMPSGLRQRKDGSLFEICDVILWNVYDAEGTRVGQSAVYDRMKVKNIDPQL